MYSFLYLMIKLMIAIKISVYECDWVAIEYFLMFLCWMCCLNMIFTLVMNMIALIKGTNFSMLVFSIGVVVLVSLAIAMVTNNIASFLNPLSINLELLQWEKIGYLLVIAVIIGGMYGMYVNKYDVGVKEVS